MVDKISKKINCRHGDINLTYSIKMLNLIGCLLSYLDNHTLNFINTSIKPIYVKSISSR